MGLIDSKSRIIDFVLTAEGRRKMSEGNLNFAFASFTDKGTFYEADVVSGSSDASKRVFLEAPSSLPLDQISFETNDSGQLVPYFGGGDQLYLVNGLIGATGSLGSAISTANFASLSSEVLEIAADNFRNLRIVGSRDDFDEDPGFELSQTEVNFTLTDEKPLKSGLDLTQITVDKTTKFFLDRRMQHVPNFSYLPPTDVDTGEAIGEFPIQNPDGSLSYEELTAQLVGKEVTTLTFPKTSQGNNLFCQMFETAKGRMTKLDVIDFGEINDQGQSKQVFFVGKVYVDKTGNGSFLNLFVLVFE